MSKITVQIGRIVSGNSGQVNDSRRDVVFDGEKLASRTIYGKGDRGGLTDTRGVTETLYRTDDGKLILHLDDWSRWQGEPSDESLQEITEADLSTTGKYSALGAEAGFGRPLTLSEALTESEGE